MTLLSRFSLSEDQPGGFAGSIKAPGTVHRGRAVSALERRERCAGLGCSGWRRFRRRVDSNPCLAVAGATVEGSSREGVRCLDESHAPF
ncbi:hypothetical protein PsYK624_024120 [Phanerochaete sordida]|uniref:Uncharacterized protein n=1 Tax=Phanerochaete sordida TaxID=48140 RepID=A0A9P3FZV7_9APHY|nr:hypothetical protein PsYK624_024120 [Phanerochaete sordida]